MTRSSTRKTSTRAPEMPNLGPIEDIPPELLRPYERNARTHGDKQIALIVQSIEAFGFTNPIVAEEDGTIIAGHGRWEAALKLGMPTVPVLRSRDLTPAKVKV
ncbi:MAG: ParB/Srx family N-terminal domain-containing protein [Croceibacterium sp.]